MLRWFVRLASFILIAGSLPFVWGAGPYGHFILARRTIDSINGGGREAPADLKEVLKDADIQDAFVGGAIAPDLCDAETSHQGETANLARKMLAKAQADFSAARDSGDPAEMKQAGMELAFSYGWFSHCAADLDIHPKINAITRDTYRHTDAARKAEHAALETQLDTYLYRRFKKDGDKFYYTIPFDFMSEFVGESTEKLKESCRSLNSKVIGELLWGKKVTLSDQELSNAWHDIAFQAVSDTFEFINNPNSFLNWDLDCGRITTTDFEWLRNKTLLENDGKLPEDWGRTYLKLYQDIAGSRPEDAAASNVSQRRQADDRAADAMKTALASEKLFAEATSRANALVARIRSLLERADDYVNRAREARSQIDANASVLEGLCIEAGSLLKRLNALATAQDSPPGALPYLRSGSFDARKFCGQVEQMTAVYGAGGAGPSPLQTMRSQLAQADRDLAAARQALQSNGAQHDLAALFAAELKRARADRERLRKTLGDIGQSLDTIKQSLLSEAQQLKQALDSVERIRQDAEKVIEQAAASSQTDSERERVATLKAALAVPSIDPGPIQAAEQRAGQIEAILPGIISAVQNPWKECENLNRIEAEIKQIDETLASLTRGTEAAPRALEEARRCFDALATLAGKIRDSGEAKSQANPAPESPSIQSPAIQIPLASLKAKNGIEDAPAKTSATDGAAPQPTGFLESFRSSGPNGELVEGTYYSKYKAEPFGRICRQYTDLGSFTSGRSGGGTICPDGILTEYYANGNKSLQKQFVDGLEEGTRLIWCENGRPRGRIGLRNGKFEGPMTWWRCDTGVVSSYREYRGELVTVEEEYWDNGQKKSHCEFSGKDDKGACTFFSSEGKTVGKR
jgi:antitoxin component YwqK of YwqJK toxin-antitoxin module